MSALKYLISSCFLLLSFNAFSNNEVYLQQLDALLELRESYFQQRLDAIDQLKTELNQTEKLSEKYFLNKEITQQYLPYNADSALRYATSTRIIALKLKESEKDIASNLLLAQAYILVGLYHESVGILEQYPEDQLTHTFQVEYYSINAVLYNTLSSLRNTDLVRKKYREKWEYFETNLRDSQKEKTLGHQLAEAELYKEFGKLDKAIEILKKILEGVQKEDRVFASTAYTLADAYGRKGLIDEKIKYLSLSSQSDIINGVKEHTALRALALELYQKGEITRAYQYIKIALEDAVDSNAQLRRSEVLEILPLIDQSYQENRDNIRRYIMLFSMIVFILSLILLSALIFIQKQKRKLEESNEQVQETNQLLNALNLELKESKQEIEVANEQLKSVNNVQEESIARYLKLCSMYIGKLDDYRRQLLRKGNKSNKEDLLKILKSKEVVDQELKIFYKDFDQSFLKLYPHFVESYNELMIEEAQITLKKNELLNTELRVFALVRLGIEESTQIAEFLRYSITTIYNYRTKARNNAKVGREHFEEELMKIQ